MVEGSGNTVKTTTEVSVPVSVLHYIVVLSDVAQWDWSRLTRVVNDWNDAHCPSAMSEIGFAH